ncbi:NAD(P)-binding domain-containing protein [Danxiaibacter flavus]|uniref:Glycerol-3-phosphate dehydrogenase n=1 Tax=Danxiaibacter flavus TaxID=3049108 RepID=A0ABV3ZMF4_9BACT|nr:NAD(P)-binding domain-containing protein [Chitinophagaceae bacterium DXS]
MLKQLAVIGSGSWATALVKIFAESGCPVSWHVRDAEQADFIKSNGRNPRYLSFAELDLEYIMPSTSLKDVVQEAQWVVFAVPASYLSYYIQDLEPEWMADKQIAVSIKGFVPGTGLIPGVYLKKMLAPDDAGDVMVLAGPCHAEEIAKGQDTYLTIAGSNPEHVHQLAATIKTPYMHVVENNDPLGVEYAAICKNIVGIASGIANGLHYGDNFQSVLICNAMRETSRLLQYIDARERDMFDSAYFGDMLVTAYSDFSRNRTLGKLVGRGMQAGKALEQMEMVAEGYQASLEMAALLQQSCLRLPILHGVYRILHQHANPYHEFKLLEKLLR